MNFLAANQILCPYYGTEAKTFPVYTDETETEIAFYALDWECPKCKQQIIKVIIKENEK